MAPVMVRRGRAGERRHRAVRSLQGEDEDFAHNPLADLKV